MKRILAVLLLSLVMGTFLSAAVACGDDHTPLSLEQGFREPPDATKPWCYWYWISDNLSQEGITRDLEAMAQAGIGEALIGNIFLEEVPAGDVKVLTPEWWELVEHAIREAGRVGVNIGMFNSPGWSQSGGPWVKPQQSMRFLVSTQTRVKGPIRFQQKLPVCEGWLQDVTVQAFPAPQEDAVTLGDAAPRISCSPAPTDAAPAVDGALDTAVVFPAGAGQGDNAWTWEIQVARPMTARHLSLTPGEKAWAASCELQARHSSGEYRTVRRFKFDRSNMVINVGPMPRGPVMIAFEPVTSDQFRLIFTQVSGEAALAEVDLSPAARLESYVEKQLGKMHPTPLPMWDTYLWPAQAEVDQPELAVSAQQVIELSDKLSADGQLQWDVPPGDWVIVRTGLKGTGTRNAPASPEGEGWEVDKMNRQVLQPHFEAFIGEVLRRMPAADRTAFKHVVADSYEMGSQNWTDGLASVFHDRYGYDPLPWLPVLTGRLVGNAEQSNRFLWDLRRLVADRVATEYVGGLRDLCRPYGLQLWLENYGHWGFPAEFLQYGGQSDCLGGEFWVTGSLGSIECRAASSAANLFGLPFISAEAFTGGPPFQTAPSGLKARGDWAFCEGINHFVLHVYIHQPWEDRKPGVNAWFGTEFNRHNTWFAESSAWIDYLRRCCFMLQQGVRVADVAYFIGEDTPKMTGVRQPPLPEGCDFDYINAEVIENSLTVKDHMLALPHGTTYRMLVLPDMATMRPQLLTKIRDLIQAGATVVGSPPSRSPSMEGYPGCDQEVQQLAAEIWGDIAGVPAGERMLGAGRVVWGKSLEEILKESGVAVDFRSDTRLLFTHRRTADADIYFVTNPQPKELVAATAYRVGGQVPELFWPESGKTEAVPVYDVVGDTTQIPLYLPPQGSVFVVFRHRAAAADRVIAFQCNGQTALDARSEITSPQDATPRNIADVTNDFTMAVWVKPAADTTLHAETNEGVRGMAEPRNDLLFPPHGSDLGGATHAGSGLAIGRNGLCVFEHGANYFVPILAHQMSLDDWTHVAVVYRNGQPTLYLDGTPVHTGLKSKHTVHPGSAGPGAAGSFVGELGALEMVPDALSDAQIAQLAQTMPRPNVRPPASQAQLTRGAKGNLELRAWQPGTYEWTTAGGQSQSVALKDVPAALAIDGPWEVQFDPQWGGPASTVFEKLDDWTHNAQDAIRYYSGKATYRRKLTVPQSFRGAPLCLDLGKVCDLAVVRINGKRVKTLWMAPWRVDVTEALNPGENLLEIDVINVWNNRLVGDSGLPADKRLTFLPLSSLAANAPLMPAGLLGPVTLQAAKVVVPMSKIVVPKDRE